MENVQSSFLFNCFKNIPYIPLNTNVWVFVPCTVDRVISRWIENKSAGEIAATASNRGQYMSLSEMTGNDIKAYATGVFKTKLQAITSSFYRI